MGLTLKITFGVFLGVIAAFLAIKAPGWIGQSRREGWYRDANLAMSNMTPDLVIQRCGKPDKDVLDRETHTRLIYFKEPFPGAVLNFWKDDKGEWSLQYMSRGGFRYGTTLPEGHPISDDGGEDNQAWNELLALPCLEGKQR
jgi:hypothetical protein